MSYNFGKDINNINKDNNNNNNYGNNDNNDNNDDQKDNNWKEFFGQCIVGIIITFIWGLWGSNLIFLAKIAARQGYPDCWGNKEDSDNNTLTLLDIYYPTDINTVPYSGICPPVIVEDYIQFRLGEYYPCGKEYDIANLRMKNWWRIFMNTWGFNMERAPYTWINKDAKADYNIWHILKSAIGASIMWSFVYARSSFKNLMFFLTLLPDSFLVIISPFLIILFFLISYFISFIGAIYGEFSDLTNNPVTSTVLIVSALIVLILLALISLSGETWMYMLISILAIPISIFCIPFLIQPFIYGIINIISMFLTYIFQPILTDAHLIFNILRCNSITMATIFGLFVLIAAYKKLNITIAHSMSGVYVLILLMNIMSIF